MEAKAGERGRKCREEGTSGQVTQESDRQTGTWAGPEGQASPALDNGEDHLGTPCLTCGMGWRGRYRRQQFWFRQSSSAPPTLG